jgi:hypothetical protein
MRLGSAHLSVAPPPNYCHQKGFGERKVHGGSHLEKLIQSARQANHLKEFEERR